MSRFDSSPLRPLPERPDLDQQRKLAKDLHRAFESGDADAVARVRRQLPDKPDVSLSDAQFVLAREYGFESWAALKAHVESVAAAAAAAAAEASRRADANPREAFRTAIRGGDVDAVRRLVSSRPDRRHLLDEPLFSFGGRALHHALGSGNRAMLETLLDLGADPNLRSDWWAGPWHLLHSAEGDFADLLIARGATIDACAAAHLDRTDELTRILDADPSRVHERGGDGQTPLHFARSREAIDLLVSRGADVNARDVDHRGTAAEWMIHGAPGRGRNGLARYLVEEKGASADVFLAAALGLTDRLRELLGTDPSLLDLRTSTGEYGDKPPSSHHIYTWTIGSTQSPMDTAALFRQDEALRVMRAYASPQQRFLAACAGADEADARRILAERPALMNELPPEAHRALADAAWASRADAVRLMLDLGFDPGAAGGDSGTALHCGAWQGSVGVARLVLDHLRRTGRLAELINRTDATHNSTPLGWCCHGSRHCNNPTGDYAAVAELLLEAGGMPGHNEPDASGPVKAVLDRWAARRR